MRNSFKLMGKSATLVAATSLLMAMTAVIPAEAANKAGARCTKANAKTKIGGDNYVCTKNPTVKNAKRTWVWVGCIESNKLYLDSNTRLKTITESAAKAITMLDTEIAALKTEAPADEAAAKVFDQKAADAKTKQAAALVEAKANTDEATKVGATTTAGTEITVEALPSVARTMNFRLTVRDNRAGGSANNSDDMIVTVNATAGPFTVNSPNTAVSFVGGSSQTITWAVAGTTANGVNCANVDILLSLDVASTEFFQNNKLVKYNYI